MNHEKMFLDECRFAKVVETPTGDALLIGGRVFYITGPTIRPGDLPLNYANLLSHALRNPSEMATKSGVNEGSSSYVVGAAA